MKLDFSKDLFQDRAVEFIKRSLENSTLPHGLLVCGESGMGQNALILNLARILLCLGKDQLPCGACSACVRKKWSALDNLTTLFPMAESAQKSEDDLAEAVEQRLENLSQDPFDYSWGANEHISISQVRALKKRLSYAEIANRRRVVLLFGLETLQDPAANALLKLLEEPPENTYILMSCENRNSVLPTLLSRSIPVPLAPYSFEQLHLFLEHRPEIPQGEGRSLIPFCGGSPGRLLQYTTGEGKQLLEQALEFIVQSQRSARGEGDVHQFSTYLSSSGGWEDRDRCLKVLGFALELMRSWNLRSVPEGTGGSEISEKLLAHFKNLPPDFDGEGYVAFLNKAIDSIGKYAKPEVALLGGWLSFEGARV